MEECTQQRRKLSREFQGCRGIFIALGDENRQQILIALLEHEQIGMRVGEITAKTHLSRPAVSHHLRILKDAGLIRMHREGTRNYYYVDAGRSRWEQMKVLIEHVDQVIQSAEQNGYPRLPEED